MRIADFAGVTYNTSRDQQTADNAKVSVDLYARLSWAFRIKNGGKGAVMGFQGILWFDQSENALHSLRPYSDRRPEQRTSKNGADV